MAAERGEVVVMVQLWLLNGERDGERIMVTVAQVLVIFGL